MQDYDFSTLANSKDCGTLSVVMHAGCSDSSDLQIETTCQPKSTFDSTENNINVMSDAPYQTMIRNGFTCHGIWREDIASDQVQEDEPVGRSHSGADANSLLLRSQPVKPAQRHYLVLSEGPTLLEDNSVSRKFLCLAYTEKDGVMTAEASYNSCDFASDSSSQHQAKSDKSINQFQITSSGPCLQALRGAGQRCQVDKSLIQMWLTMVLATLLLNRLS